MTQVGRTDSGVPVVAGLFVFYDTHGLPFADIFDMLQMMNVQPSWPCFIAEAREHGWKNATIYSRLKEAIQDVYGKTYWEEVEKKLNEFNLLSL